MFLFYSSSYCLSFWGWETKFRFLLKKYFPLHFFFKKPCWPLSAIRKKSPKHTMDFCLHCLLCCSRRLVNSTASWRSCAAPCKTWISLFRDTKSCLRYSIRCMSASWTTRYPVTGNAMPTHHSSHWPRGSKTLSSVSHSWRTGLWMATLTHSGCQVCSTHKVSWLAACRHILASTQLLLIS